MKERLKKEYRKKSKQIEAESAAILHLLCWQSIKRSFEIGIETIRIYNSDQTDCPKEYKDIYQLEDNLL